jgi:ATP-dependent helicase/nuclease subunit B
VQAERTKLHHGLVQLLSYLGVMQRLKDPQIVRRETAHAVGVFYVPLNGGGARPGRTRTEVVSADATQRRMAYQHSGRFLADMLEHFDNRNESRGDQFKYALKKDDSLAARGNEAIPSDEFEALREKIEGHLRDYGQRIFAGEVEVAPFRIGQQTACEYCDFRAVCRFDPWAQRIERAANDEDMIEMSNPHGHFDPHPHPGLSPEELVASNVVCPCWRCVADN